MYLNKVSQKLVSENDIFRKSKSLLPVRESKVRVLRIKIQIEKKREREKESQHGAGGSS